jgi:hypothetical protein
MTKLDKLYETDPSKQPKSMASLPSSKQQARRPGTQGGAH